MANTDVPPPFVLFGYDSSPFTHKIKLALKFRRIPYTFVVVPSMMPRPILLSAFNLTYRKIPVMAIGKELYIDTSLILETIAAHPSYPPSKSHPPLHPSVQHRTLTRLLSSHYTDRPLFRLTTGLIPQVVWSTSFGVDRASLIGHKLNAEKLGAKIPRNLAALDTYLSILEPLFANPNPKNNGEGQGWTYFLGTTSPTAADISLYYQLYWGKNISRGIGIANLTGGGTHDGQGEGMEAIFTSTRYPNLLAWYARVQNFFENLPDLETRIEHDDAKAIQHITSTLDACEQVGPVPMLATPVQWNEELDKQNGLVLGKRVGVAPDDTGRDDPTMGTLVALSTEEVVLVPDVIEGRAPGVNGVRVHFPRVGFVVREIEEGSSGVRVVVRTKGAKL